jgi:hypothetical protein
MGVRAPHTLASQPVDARRQDLRRTVTREISDPKVVSNDEDNVRPGFGLGVQRSE